MIDRTKLRTCLGCGKSFLSLGPGNRFCKTCKQKRKRFEGGIDPIILPPRSKKG